LVAEGIAGRREYLGLVAIKSIAGHRSVGLADRDVEPDSGINVVQVGVPVSSLCEAPAHLSNVQAAALPLGGLTAYRALVTKGRVAAGTTVLVTGCGGGVALLAVQLAVAIGANVFVTSGSDDKIDRAVALGALGGVNYKTKGWHKQLGSMLKDRGLELDSVIDGAYFSLHFLSLLR
jgi:zinc-binding alcohol dehydrogenase/oxidoreductase